MDGARADLQALVLQAAALDPKAASVRPPATLTTSAEGLPAPARSSTPATAGGSSIWP